MSADTQEVAPEVDEEEVWDNATVMAALATSSPAPTALEFFEIMMLAARGEDMPEYNPRFAPMIW